MRMIERLLRRGHKAKPADPQAEAEAALEREKAEAHEEYVRLKAEADTKGLSLSGTYLPSGRPTYFLTPPDATPEEVRAMAFEIREGRAMSGLEEWLLERAGNQLEVTQ